MEEVLHRTSLAPSASPCFILLLVGLQTKGLWDFQGSCEITSTVRWNLHPVTFALDSLSVALHRLQCITAWGTHLPYLHRTSKSSWKFQPRAPQRGQSEEKERQTHVTTSVDAWLPFLSMHLLCQGKHKHGANDNPQLSFHQFDLVASGMGSMSLVRQRRCQPCISFLSLDLYRLCKTMIFQKS